MKIEKVNDNQIRCTLTREDLVSRQLKISELAYGSEKAKNLFRDMMQQANFEFGFEAEDIPLMIEAIPLNAECIVLIITKVEDPEELDPRFSRFAPSMSESEEDEENTEDAFTPAKEVMDLFRRLQDTAVTAAEASPKTESTQSRHVPEAPATRIFQLDSLNTLLNAASLAGSFYQGESVLYKDEQNDCYLLLLSQGSATQEDFNKVSNVMSEYGRLRRNPGMSRSFLEEHFVPMIAENALHALAQIG